MTAPKSEITVDLTQMPPTPVLDKRSEVIEESHAIGRFLDWLSEQGIRLARYQEMEGEDLDDPIQLFPINEGPSSLLHRYFGIDANEEERELRAVLDHVRKQA